MKTEILRAGSRGERRVAVAQAVKLLRAGEIVALPTETVYGLAADALNIEAVVKIFAAKERPRFDPLIVHIPDRNWFQRVAVIPEDAREIVGALAKEFWPGPLTFVLPRHEIVPDVVTAGLATVATRVSAHELWSEIIREFGGPLAAPSANRFGHISPTMAEHVRDELDGLIPLIVDGGATAHGLESTIIAVRNRRIEILRRGPVTEEQLRFFGEIAPSPVPLSIEAPGQMRSHYAPSTPLLVIEDGSAFIPPAGKRCGLLAWNPDVEPARFAEVRILSAKQDLTEAATNLFRFLRELDEATLDLLVAEAVPERSLGAAIMDRLRRAAARDHSVRAF
ncbi:MAG: L-threonylcarbamoyladenylate synthase [Chthoniobacterales bacterium]